MGRSSEKKTLRRVMKIFGRGSQHCYGINYAH
jgi:hypothetical protein